jgi:hypothetical protein
MLKIIGGIRDSVVARASRKSPADIVRHAGNQRKSAAGAQAATHPSSKSAAIGKPAPVNIIQLLNLLLVLKNLLLLVLKNLLLLNLILL